MLHTISEHMAWVQALQYVSVVLVHFTALIEPCADDSKHTVLQNRLITEQTTPCKVCKTIYRAYQKTTASNTTSSSTPQDPADADFDLTAQKHTTHTELNSSHLDHRVLKSSMMRLNYKSNHSKTNKHQRQLSHWENVGRSLFIQT